MPQHRIMRLLCLSYCVLPSNGLIVVLLSILMHVILLPLSLLYMHFQGNRTAVVAVWQQWEAICKPGCAPHATLLAAPQTVEASHSGQQSLPQGATGCMADCPAVMLSGDQVLMHMCFVMLSASFHQLTAVQVVDSLCTHMTLCNTVDQWSCM